jgi:hypothetical protein
MREPPTFMRVLKQKELLPEQHIVDTGYVDAQLLHSSQQNYGLDLVGPTRPQVKWQAQQKSVSVQERQDGFESRLFSKGIMGLSGKQARVDHRPGLGSDGFSIF